MIHTNTKLWAGALLMQVVITMLLLVTFASLAMTYQRLYRISSNELWILRAEQRLQACLRR